jgi:hypothetical protein
MRHRAVRACRSAYERGALAVDDAGMSPIDAALRSAFSAFGLGAAVARACKACAPPSACSHEVCAMRRLWSQRARQSWWSLLLQSHKHRTAFVSCGRGMRLHRTRIVQPLTGGMRTHRHVHARWVVEGAGTLARGRTRCAAHEVHAWVRGARIAHRPWLVIQTKSEMHTQRAPPGGKLTRYSTVRAAASRGAARCRRRNPPRDSTTRIRALRAQLTRRC